MHMISENVILKKHLLNKEAMQISDDIAIAVSNKNIKIHVFYYSHYNLYDYYNYYYYIIYIICHNTTIKKSCATVVSDRPNRYNQIIYILLNYFIL